ncbi:bacillithiol biosynthesis cysteine-adding enzyme BshC [Allomuricauda sp. SCSIO 65647]|uniref:bacillithiol biosynthesis cysteine-adding enzyme BshC n=1 Tax=Allomuricauda sp. SCSIO 65647 TaxID=2908843 RepID=UPI001F3EEDF0|nr:bacillithiol biosynthesis cysteine-adding enzyme BshC [Muricauda sp. SCSIO 65647]UJH67943.1 bacillithiol biosynthesis cysteine-adding enzyme BshC [Muricauda sp. SCSIO 65647]
MEIDCLSFRETGYFSSLICDYLDEKEELRSFYNRFPKLENFEGQIKEKATNFSSENRKILVSALKEQYGHIRADRATSQNILRLEKDTTFTVVTGHQLNLFTGPLYFLYKIVSTINLTKRLKQAYPGYDFVPVYWMATEDHDFDEINHFSFKGKKIRWNRSANGAVGRLSTDGLNGIFEVFSAELGESPHAEYLKKLFKEAYLEHSTLTEATRFLANELFGEQGLVIVDGDNAHLKRLLVPYAEKDIFEQLPYKEVSKSNEKLSRLSNKYSIQVNPREINFFYLKDGLRERIIEKRGNYFINDTELQFSKAELLKELHDHPERFSPNVIARPLYQEIILPNLCYIGGGGELAYWLELKSYFDALGIVFPVLLLRNSALVLSTKHAEKIKRLGLQPQDLFLKQNSLINKKIRQISNIDINFAPQKKILEEQFAHLYELAKQTDKSFLGAVRAQEKKQKNGLDKLEKRLLKAQRRRLKDHVMRLTEIQNELFPGQSLQERQLNFSELYLAYGDVFIEMLQKSLNPLQQDFLVLRS